MPFPFLHADTQTQGTATAPLGGSFCLCLGVLRVKSIGPRTMHTTSREPVLGLEVHREGMIATSGVLEYGQSRLQRGGMQARVLRDE